MESLSVRVNVVEVRLRVNKMKFVSLEGSTYASLVPPSDHRAHRQPVVFVGVCDISQELRSSSNRNAFFVVQLPETTSST